MSNETLSAIVEAAAQRGAEKALAAYEAKRQPWVAALYHAARRGIMAVLNIFDGRYGKEPVK